MIAYFGYGSNINLTSLRAKGVQPIRSERALLRGWKLRFNVQHWFRHEGGVGNIQPSSDPEDFVEGILHFCKDEELASLDAMESAGIGYERINVYLETADGLTNGFAYIGLPDFLDEKCLPTQRYLNIITRGAESAGLSQPYIERLRRHPIFIPEDYPAYEYPADKGISYTLETLSQHPYLTALAEAVFDMRGCRKKLECLFDLFGGKDMTLFHVKRHDTSSGQETLEDIRQGNISPGAKKYLNAYLHEYKREFRYAGRYTHSIR